MKKNLFTLISALFLLQAQAQIAEINPLAASRISADLKKNAHAVVRQYDLTFEVKNKGEAIETEHKVVTLLDEKAAHYSEPLFAYDKIREIDDIEATVYDGSGKLVRKMKKKDIDDFKPYEEGVDDGRCKRITFPRLPFPYTVEYTVKTHHKGLLHYPIFAPQRHFNEAVEKSVYTITKSDDVKLKFKELNIPKGSSSQEGNTSRWSIEKVNALVHEPFTSALLDPLPEVWTTPDVFSVGGFSGKFDSWLNYGKFQAELNKGRMELPQTVVNEVRKLVEDCSDDYCKIERIYKKLQNTTRYFSIQLGIGGWQPIAATDVDRRKYGDCKALSNYMLAMLRAVHIEGQYVVIKAGDDNQIQYPDFPNAYFNHVIACVPMKNDTVWLECTSQTAACGYLGTFTDNRPALLIAPEGGHLVQTPVYDEKTNFIRRNIKLMLNTEGGAQLKATSVYSGTKQELASRLSEYGADIRKKYMYEKLGINDFEIKNLIFKKQLSRLPTIEEQLDLDIRQLGSASGKRQFIPVNLLSAWKETFATDSTRRFDVQADSRGFTQIDSITITIPTGFKAESLPEPLSIKSLFGQYDLTAQLLDKNNVLIKRKFVVTNKIFPAKNQIELAVFFKQVAKADKVKMVLVKE